MTEQEKGDPLIQVTTEWRWRHRPFNTGDDRFDSIWYFYEITYKW